MEEDYKFDPSKMLPEYRENPKLRLKHLLEFRERLKTKHILGEQNKEYRRKLEHILVCCEDTIIAVRGMIWMQGLGEDYKNDN